jgi:hypothetical protein
VREFVPLLWEIAQRIRDGLLKGVPYPEDFNGPGFAPTQPTNHLPGTEEKIAVFAARYQRRERLFHPDDLGARPAR